MLLVNDAPTVSDCSEEAHESRSAYRGMVFGLLGKTPYWPSWEHSCAGTSMSRSVFPYRGKRAVNVTATFDPFFSMLYVFTETLNIRRRQLRVAGVSLKEYVRGRNAIVPTPEESRMAYRVCLDGERAFFVRARYIILKHQPECPLLARWANKTAEDIAAEALFLWEYLR